MSDNILDLVKSIDTRLAAVQLSLETNVKAHAADDAIAHETFTKDIGSLKTFRAVAITAATLGGTGGISAKLGYLDKILAMLQ